MFEQEGPSTTPAPEVAGPESITPGAPAATEAEEEAPAVAAPAATAPAAPAPDAPAPAEAPAEAPGEAAADGGSPVPFGGNDADGEYQPMQVVSDDLGGMS
ncbi:MAG: hypothetical protein QOI86_3166, partial [Actinomycetota bacterium]|nr:hypothetical protein [Actinomycetota bacterium]